jgi:hypothetical protein
MYITNKLKIELQAAGVDPLDKVAVKQYHADKYTAEVAKEQERITALKAKAAVLNHWIEPHSPTVAELDLFDLIKIRTQGKFYKWMYIDHLGELQELQKPEYLWDEVNELGWYIGKYDLSRLIACGLLFKVAGHYKTEAEFEKIKVYSNPIEYFDNKDIALRYLLSHIPDTVVRMKAGKVVFKLRDLVKDLFGDIMEKVSR